MKKTAVAVLIVLLISLLLTVGACTEATPKVVTEKYIDEAGVQYTIFTVTTKDKTESRVGVTGYDGKKASSSQAPVTVNVLSEISVGGVSYPVTSVENTAFYRADVNQINVGENVTFIGDFAFAYCGAEEIVLPKAIEKIGDYAFVNCNSLKVVRINSEQPPVIGEYVFMFYDTAKNVYEPQQYLRIKVPSASKAAYFDAWYDYASILN